MKIRYFLVTAVLATAILCFAAVGANAQTSLEWCHNFNKSFGYNNSGNSEVGFLHTALQKEGISFSPDTGNKFSKEGGTSSAVIAFQEKYGILPLSGYVGPLTRAKLNELYGCTHKECDTAKKQCVSATGAGKDLCSKNSECVLPSIAVTSPNGGETWQTGKEYNIKWKETALGNPTIKIDLTDSAGNQTNIVSALNAPSNSYQWTVPATITQGSQYKITVSALYNAASSSGGSSPAEVSDSSDNYFSIVIKHKECNDKQQCVSVDGVGDDTCAKNIDCQSKITVTSPTGGEEWQKGRAYDIKWTSNKVDTVDIYRYGYHYPYGYSYLEEVTSKDKIVEGVTASVGKYSWLIPSDFSSKNLGKSKIVIRKADVASDFSKVFSIVDAPAVTVMSPNGGEILLPGQKYNIKWTEISLKNPIINIVLTDSAGNETKIASTLKAPSKSYSWIVPLTIIPGNQYKITVSALYNPAPSGGVEAATVSDASDNYFSIGAIHNACDLKMQCISVVGVGTSACSADSDCVATTHNECTTNKQCVAVMGAGENKCAKNSDCSSLIATSAGLEQSIFNSMAASLANIAEQIKALMTGR